MPDKPFLFLDVDGVLNCFDETGDHCTVYQQANGFPVWIPNGTEARLKALDKYFEIVWATAWMGTAHGAFKDILNLPDFWPHISWSSYKLPEIIRWAGERPWAWIDDDIEFELKHLGWDRDRMILDNVLLQDINPNLGLSDGDVHELIYWAKTHDK